MRYLNGMLDMVLTLEYNEMNIAKCWVDSYLIIHKDMKIHTSETISLRKGSVYSLYTNHNINSTIYT